MPALTAALNSLPVESVDVLPIGTLEALETRRGAVKNGAHCFCHCFSCSCSCSCFVPLFSCGSCI